MSHYYTDSPEVAHEYRDIPFYYKGQKLVFRSDAGVFSKGRVDEASELLLNKLPPLSGSLLDVGCGYGALGLSLGKTTPGLAVTMCDINPRALELARQNAAQNGVGASAVLSDCLDSVEGLFDCIITNPPIRAGKQVVFKIYEQSRERLKEGGRFFCVIQKKHGAESSIKKLTEVFGGCEVLYKKSGYYVLVALR